MGSDQLMGVSGDADQLAVPDAVGGFAGPQRTVVESAYVVRPSRADDHQGRLG